MDKKLYISTITAVFLLAACAGAGPATSTDVPAESISKRDLLSGEALFGERVDTATIPDPGLFVLDDEMRAFVWEHVRHDRSNRDRLRRLLSGMVETGLMSLDYNDARTKTAREMFHDRVGNCMSFTSLFVALAREAKLDVTFQTVDVPPIWYADSELVILNNHVNALVTQTFGRTSVVDFNVTEMKGDYATRPVSDDYALALYFNNLAMESLRADDHLESFRLLKKSIETYSKIAGSWANLGVIYSRNGAEHHAIAAYEVALRLDRDHRPSLVNLSTLYKRMGDTENAEHYARMTRRYQEQNPYYHYYHAVAAYNTGDFVTASERLRRAIKLKDTEHKFFRLQGLIAERQGDLASALASFVQAQELAVYSDARRSYDNKIAALTADQ